MITLNDYLYSGDTILRILHNYIHDLRKDAKKTHNEIDMIHCNFLILIRELLEHNDFLTAQSQQIREFYKYMAKEYPFLAFTFRGRIKSLIRAEEKFNGYVVEYIYNYYTEHGLYPSLTELKNRLSCFRDFIAYRIVIAMPRCHLKCEGDREKEELKYLYEIANVLPGFLEERGFTAEPANGVKESTSSLLNEDVRLGKESFWIWDDTTPSIGEGDLMICACGSANVGHENYVADMAKKNGAKLALITPSSEGFLLSIADMVVNVPAAAYKAVGDFVPSEQLMGNLFEQTLFIFYDILVMMLREEMDIKPEEMVARHRNVE